MQCAKCPLRGLLFSAQKSDEEKANLKSKKRHIILKLGVTFLFIFFPKSDKCFFCVKIASNLNGFALFSRIYSKLTGINKQSHFVVKI